MSEEYGNDFIVVSDDEGNEFELEHLDTAEINGSLYMAFVPADSDEDDDDYGLVILKVTTRDDEEILSTVDDDAELEAVFDVFVERLAEEDEEPEEEV